MAEVVVRVEVLLSDWIVATGTEARSAIRAVVMPAHIRALMW